MYTYVLRARVEWKRWKPRLERCWAGFFRVYIYCRVIACGFNAFGSAAKIYWRESLNIFGMEIKHYSIECKCCYNATIITYGNIFHCIMSIFSFYIRFKLVHADANIMLIAPSFWVKLRLIVPRCSQARFARRI